MGLSEGMNEPWKEREWATKSGYREITNGHLPTTDSADVLNSCSHPPGKHQTTSHIPGIECVLRTQ